MFGSWPIATKTPLNGTSASFFDSTFCTRRPVTFPALTSSTSVTTEFQRKSILGLFLALSCMIFDARSSFRRWTIVTFDANRVRNVASSTAVSPPPITASGLLRKSGSAPSQVAHAERPRFMRAFSEGIPRNFAPAPVAMMTAFASYSFSPVESRNGRFVRSSFPTHPDSIRVPNRSAWWRMSSISSGPCTPFGNPG